MLTTRPWADLLKDAPWEVKHLPEPGKGYVVLKEGEDPINCIRVFSASGDPIVGFQNYPHRDIDRLCTQLCRSIARLPELLAAKP